MQASETNAMAPAFVIYRQGNALQLKKVSAMTKTEKRHEDVGLIAATPILRLCAVDEVLLLLNCEQQLLLGRCDNNAMELHLELLRHDVQDVDYCRSTRTLYIVTSMGGVYAQFVGSGRICDTQWQSIVFDPLELAEDGIRIVRVKCSLQGVLFVTASSDLYALGSCGEIFQSEQQPQHLRLFEQHQEIIDLVAGDEHFALLLKIEPDEQSLENSDLWGHTINNKAASSLMRPSTSPEREPSSVRSVAEHVSVQRHKRNSSTASANSISSQASTSQHSGEKRQEATLQQLLRHGFGLLQTQVHTFGGANGGLLGTGDHIRRADASCIKKLAGIGVCAVAAGRSHSIARTLDGRVFHWGLNSKQQLNNNSECADISAPQELKLDAAELSVEEQSILDACCGDYQTLLVNAKGSLFARDVQLKRDLLCRVENAGRQAAPLLLASGSFTLHNFGKRPLQQQFYAPLNSLQLQLQSLLMQRPTVEALQRFRNKNNSPGIRHIFYVSQCFINLLYYLAAALQSLELYYRGDMENAADLLMVRYFKPSIALFEDYTKAYCDVRSINGFVEAAKVYAHFSNLPTAAAGTVPAIVDMDRLFQQPFKIFPPLMQCLELLSKTQIDFTEQLLSWQSFTRQQRIDLELADNTQEFWLRNERTIKLRNFRRKQRRVILSSETVPLRLSNSALNYVPGTQPYFILFSDCLCQLGSHLQTFPLVAMWLKLESDKTLRVTTPEKSFTLVARTQHDKMLWYDQMEFAIAAVLGRGGVKLSSSRTMAYVYSPKHPKYGGVDAYGQWRNGMLHGNCYLQFPDDKFYLGEARHGEIEGYGKMVMPSIGIYEGNFKMGKFHGHGCYEMKDNEIYTGHFRDGLFHGHGMLRTNAYTYVGEFQANAKCGYGIQDDTISGEKYMGMFADNKRTGAGTCITMNGDYFEGIFVNDELAGQGIAVFENNYFFEGELTLHGPMGKGTYYMPHGSIESDSTNIEDDTESSKRLMIGNVLNGTLGGSWNDVRVAAGSVAINKQFPKYPKSIGDMVVDNSRKWRSLFENFEEELLGSNTTNATTNSKELWSCIAVYMTTLRERDKTREQQDSSYQSYVHSYFAKNISMGYNANLDKISLKSTNSLMNSTKSSILDLSGDASVARRSYSQETLFECDMNDLDFMNSTTFQNEENSFQNLLNTQLGSWANDSSSSLRSSFDSALNLSNNSKNNSVLDFVPNFGMTSLTSKDVDAIKDYLAQAFKDAHHPLHHLNQRIANSFYTSYGCWKVKPTPILAKQAMREWESISKRVYQFVRKMFPALPEDFCVIESTREVVSHITLLYPIVLSEGIYSTLFVLYANKYSDKDEMYRQNLLFAEKLTDVELSVCLSLDSVLLPVVSNEYFNIAIQTLKQVQEKYSPKAMLTVIEKCMQLIEEAHKLTESENTVILAADSMMPLTLFLVLRAAVPHLGAELALLDDLTGGSNFQIEMNGFAGYCYTTLKASYEHITAAPLKQT